MGKILIIKGADFSSNAIFNYELEPYVWYLNSFNENCINPAKLNNGGWCIKNQSLLSEKTINTLRFRASKEGKDINNIVIKTIPEFKVPKNGYIVIGESDINQGGFCYGSYDESLDIGFYSKVLNSSSELSDYYNDYLGFDFGYKMNIQ